MKGHYCLFPHQLTTVFSHSKVAEKLARIEEKSRTSDIVPPPGGPQKILSFDKNHIFMQHVSDQQMRVGKKVDPRSESICEFAFKNESRCELEAQKPCQKIRIHIIQTVRVSSNPIIFGTDVYSPLQNEPIPT